MDKETRHNLVRKLFATTGSSYDLVVKAATLWQDSLWKKRILDIAGLCDDPKMILDLACGTGIVTFALAKKFPKSTVVGIDLQEEYLAHARAKKLENNIKNVEFYEKSAEDTKEGKYDLITASYLPKYVDLDVVIGNCSGMLNPGGLIIFHDFIYPRNRVFRIFYDSYWVILSFFLQFSHEWGEIGRGLKGIIAQSTWLDEIQKALKENRFDIIRIEVQRFEIAAIVYARR